MSQDVFKIYHLEYNNINKIDVFNGINGEIDKDDVFDREELEEITDKNIKIDNNESTIFLDDSIDIIKKKILNINASSSNEIIYEELYLYCEQQISLTIEEIFNNLKHKDIGFVSKNVLINFLYNIKKQEILIDKLSITKDYYDYNEFIQFFYELNEEYIDEISVIIQIPLELEIKKMKYNSEKNIYPFLVNPFGPLTPSDHKYETNSYNILFKKINKPYKNRIFCCLASDVLKYASSQSYNETDYIKQFYPLLYKADILDLTQLEQKKHNIFIEYNQKKLLYLENDQKIETLNKIYVEKSKLTEEGDGDGDGDSNDGEKDEKDSEDGDSEEGEKAEKDSEDGDGDSEEGEKDSEDGKGEKNQKGFEDKENILNIEFKIKSGHSNTIPLDIIFKNIHSTLKMPFVKFIPSNKMENIYRLYTDQISYDGTKIPFLSKLEIKKKKRNRKN